MAQFKGIAVEDSQQQRPGNVRNSLLKTHLKAFNTSRSIIRCSLAIKSVLKNILYCIVLLNLAKILIESIYVTHNIKKTL